MQDRTRRLQPRQLRCLCLSYCDHKTLTCVLLMFADNPPVCGLPECWAAGPRLDPVAPTSRNWPFSSIKVTDLTVPANKRNDETDAGRKAAKKGHKLWYKISSFADDQFPNKKNGFRGADLQLPALRQGSADEVSNGPGNSPHLVAFCFSKYLTFFSAGRVHQLFSGARQPFR